MSRFWARIRGWFLGRRPSPDAGRMGERLAASWLEHAKHFRILAVNWRAPRDRRLELDLVARDGDALVFVEVKTRSARALVSGYYAAVAKRKRDAVERAARAFIHGLGERPRTVRYDVVEVSYTRVGEEPEVRHFENVPLFPKGFLRGR